MFCYQPEIHNGTTVIPSVLNSRTELMTRQKWHELLSSPQSRWLVEKHRQVRQSPGDSRWTADADYLEYVRRLKGRQSREARKLAACASDEQRIAMWCDSLKRRLPFVIFVATYPERSAKEGGERARWRNQQFAQLTGLVVIDFDHVEGDVTERWNECYGRLSDADRARILLVFVSPGGHGLKLVVKADASVGNLIDNQIVFSRKLGLTVDESCKDAARGTFLTTEDDILMINENELFEYENNEFAEKFNDQYRRGNSQPTLPFADDADDAGNPAGRTDAEPADTAADKAGKGGDGTDGHQLSYGSWTGTLDDLLRAYYPGQPPGPREQGGSGASRHTESLKWAYDLLIMTGRNKALVERLLRRVPWVAQIVSERQEPVGDTVKDADARLREREKKYGENVKPSKAMLEAISRLQAGQPVGDGTVADDEDAALHQQLEAWGERIRRLFGLFPCLKESCHDLQTASYPAALFVSAAFLGTDLTRTWYHFYHRPEETRRLNYSVIIIGDPGSGKSFATRLYYLLAAPLITADKVGNDAINRYKKELLLRASSSKEQKKDGLKQPEVTIRVHGARTANGVFIEDMSNAVEVVDGQPLHLHMLTFDSELDSITMAQKGGQWIDKSTMELKAFHNEEDNQQYKNANSVNGPFNVYWNFVYTGTPLSLNRKVTERNFGSGLSTRLAVIPMPASGYKMMALRPSARTDHQADETLKTWAFRLDGVSGELPLWPLVEHTWHWTNERMQIAAFNRDKADEMLLKRVAYYGIAIATPFVLMRHWDEWQQRKTFSIDDTDRELCTLAMDIQYAMQWRFFGEMAKAYFDNLKTKALTNRRRPSKYDYCYERLPKTFTISDVENCYGIGHDAALKMASRLCEGGFVSREKKGQYQKLKQTLL